MLCMLGFQARLFGDVEGAISLLERAVYAEPEQAGAPELAREAS